jgi:hypothetical protein
MRIAGIIGGIVGLASFAYVVWVDIRIRRELKKR